MGKTLNESIHEGESTFELDGLTIDVRLVTLSRQMDDVEYEMLKESIGKYGVMYPIVIWKGHNTVIDGYHRLKACVEGGIPYETVEMEFDTFDDVSEWVILNQLGRSNISDYTKSFLTIALEKIRRSDK